MLTIKNFQSFSNELVCIRKKWISKTLVLAFKFHGRRHLEYLWRVVVALLFWHKARLFWNNRATTTRHNYSRWQRPGNLKAKLSVFEIYYSRIQKLSLEKGLSNFNCKHYVLWFKVIVLFRWRLPLIAFYWVTSMAIPVRKWVIFVIFFIFIFFTFFLCHKKSFLSLPW